MNRFGPVRNIDCHTGWAYVEFEYVPDAERCVIELDRAPFEGRV